MSKSLSLIGKNYHFQLNGNDFYIDFLFYHQEFQCFVVIVLKKKAFYPGDLGTLNFYLAVVDDLIRQPTDKRTLGLLLCKSKNDRVADLAFQAWSSPMAVAEYTGEIVAQAARQLKEVKRA